MGRVTEWMEKLSADVDEQELDLWGTPTQGPVDLRTSPKFQEIVSMLHEQPLLVSPVHEWLKVKQSQMAQAQLVVLYGQERTEQMMEEARQRER